MSSRDSLKGKRAISRAVERWLNIQLQFGAPQGDLTDPESHSYCPEAAKADPDALDSYLESLAAKVRRKP